MARKGASSEKGTELEAQQPLEPLLVEEVAGDKRRGDHGLEVARVLVQQGEAEHIALAGQLSQDGQVLVGS